MISDDDTFYPDFDSLARLLASHDPDEDWLIGTLSESTKQVRAMSWCRAASWARADQTVADRPLLLQVAQWGHIAYGGAGIILSRSVLEKMNESGFCEF